MLTRDPKPPDKGTPTLIDQDQPFCYDLHSDEFEVRRALAHLKTYLTRQQVPPGGVERIELICAEAMNNAVEHGYEFKKGLPIWLSCYVDGGRVILQVSDRGHPIPDTLIRDSSMPDPQLYQEVLREGGWGWALIHHLCSNISYRREHDTNLLILQVHLDTEGDQGEMS